MPDDALVTLQALPGVELLQAAKAVCGRSPAAMLTERAREFTLTKAPVSLQDLRRRLYAKAKSEASWRFWGRFVHVCKMETLREACRGAKANDGAPDPDGVTFEAIEAAGVEAFLEQMRDELVQGTCQPTGYRRRSTAKPDGGGERLLSIGAIRDRMATCSHLRGSLAMPRA